MPTLATAAAIRSAAGDREGALRYVAELAAVTRDRDPSKRAHELPLPTRVAVTWGSAAIARGMVPDGEPVYLRSRLCTTSSHAILAEADGNPHEASERFTGCRAVAGPPTGTRWRRRMPGSEPPDASERSAEPGKYIGTLQQRDRWRRPCGRRRSSQRFAAGGRRSGSSA